MSYQQALQDIESGNFEAAIAQLDALLRVDPNQPELWKTKALALLSSKQPEAAIVAAEQAIRLSPSMAMAHRLLGKAYSMVGNNQKAIPAYKIAARHYLDRQDKTNAQACLERIDRLRPQNISSQSLKSSQLFLEAAIAKIQAGRHRDALGDLDWLLNLEPDNARALAQRGMLQTQLRNNQAAASDLARAIKLAPNDPDLRLQRAQMRLLLGDAHGAIADLSALLQSKSAISSQVYTLRGRAYQQIGDLDNAFKDFSNALGIDPNDAACHKSRGDVCEATDDLEEALANYRQAATLFFDRGAWNDYESLQRLIKTLESKLQIQKEKASRIIHIPIKEFRGGTPVIEVVFNGHCPCDMILDTGAGITSLTQEMAHLLNIVPTGTKYFQVADGRIVEKSVGFVRSIAIGQAKIDNLEVAISPTAAHGLLGQNYLWRYDVRILRTEVELHLR